MAENVALPIGGMPPTKYSGDRKSGWATSNDNDSVMFSFTHLVGLIHDGEDKIYTID